jgi:hypothetical protein
MENENNNNLMLELIRELGQTLVGRINTISIQKTEPQMSSPATTTLLTKLSVTQLREEINSPITFETTKSAVKYFRPAITRLWYNVVAMCLAYKIPERLAETFRFTLEDVFHGDRYDHFATSRRLEEVLGAIEDLGNKLESQD